MTRPLTKTKELLLTGLAPIVVFTFNAIISKGTTLYEIYPAIDIPMHFLGGCAIAYMLVRFYKILPLPKTPYFFNLLVVTAGTISAAVIWEFAEFLSDHYLGTHTQLGLPDTMLDLLMGMLGGIVIGLIFKKKL